MPWLRTLNLVVQPGRIILIPPFKRQTHGTMCIQVNLLPHLLGTVTLSGITLWLLLAAPQGRQLYAALLFLVGNICCFMLRIIRDTLARDNARRREQAPITIGLPGYYFSYLVLIYVVALEEPLWPDLMGVESPAANCSGPCYHPGCHDHRLV